MRKGQLRTARAAAVAVAALWAIMVLADELTLPPTLPLAHSPWRVVFVVCEIAAIMSMPFLPTLGPCLVLAVWEVSGIVRIPTASTMLFVSIFALAMLGYRHWAVGLAAACLTLSEELAGALTGGYVPWLSLMYRSAAVLAGVAVRYAQRMQQTALEERERRRRRAAAAMLHDRIANSLSYLIMLDDQRGGVMAADERAALEQSLGWTRQAIGMLEPEETGTANRRGATSARRLPLPRAAETTPLSHLKDAVERGQRRLERLGFHGQVVITGLDRRQVPDNLFCTLEGLVGELLANVTHHAERTEPYCLVIGATDDVLSISMSDTATDDTVADDATDRPDQPDAAEGSGTGLKRYQGIIKEWEGTCDVSEQCGMWTWECAIPLTRTEYSDGKRGHGRQ